MKLPSLSGMPIKLNITLNSLLFKSKLSTFIKEVPSINRFDIFLISILKFLIKFKDSLTYSSESFVKLFYNLILFPSISIIEILNWIFSPDAKSFIVKSY